MARRFNRTPYILAPVLLLTATSFAACSDPESDSATGGESAISVWQKKPKSETNADGGIKIADGPSAPASEFSYIGQKVIQTLSQSETHAPWQNRTWGTSNDNAFEPGWVLQTPLEQFWGDAVENLPLGDVCEPGTSNCEPDYNLRVCHTQADCKTGTCREVASFATSPGTGGRKLCSGHSDAIADEVYKQMIRGEEYVDITTLGPPDGQFETAMRNAITYLSHKPKPPQVRIVFGNFPTAVLSRKIDDVLESLTRDVSASSTIKVFVGQYRYKVESWNHSKIIAYDGKSAIVGGENLWGSHYLGKNPVHDISMRIQGSSAVHAHLYANELWDYTCNKNSLGGSSTTVAFPKKAGKCPEPYKTSMSKPGTGHSRVIAVGRLGAIGNNAADDAQIAMIAAAKQSVRMSLQDLGPFQLARVSTGPWPEALFAELGKAMARGVDVQIVVSNLNAVAGGLKWTEAIYSNSWTLEDAAGKLRKYLLEHASILPTGTNIDRLLCNHFRIASLRPSYDDTWPDGNLFANHAKTFMVDDSAFYIGSQNVYYANLAEYGFIVDDAEASKTMSEQFWVKLWDNSSRVAISGASHDICSE